MDDGIGGDFIDIFGSSTNPMTSNTMILYYTANNLIRGRRYGYRYRARNIYGWSAMFSDITYILAIERP